MSWWILDAKGDPVPEPDEAKWNRWMEDDGLGFGWTDEFHTRTGRFLVQTIFVGEEPVWKTIVHQVGTPLEADQETYTGGSAKQAERRHAIIRERVRQRAEVDTPPAQA